MYHGFESRKSKKDKDKAKDLNMCLCCLPTCHMSDWSCGSRTSRTRAFLCNRDMSVRMWKMAMSTRARCGGSQAVGMGPVGVQVASKKPSSRLRWLHEASAQGRKSARKPRVQPSLRFAAEALVSTLQGRLAASAICEVVPGREAEHSAWGPWALGLFFAGRIFLCLFGTPSDTPSERHRSRTGLLTNKPSPLWSQHLCGLQVCSSKFASGLGTEATEGSTDRATAGFEPSHGFKIKPQIVHIQLLSSVTSLHCQSAVVMSLA